MLISASENGLPRYYAPSLQILKERETYFQLLETCQKGGLDITEWVKWYLWIIEKSILDIKTVQIQVVGKQKLEDKMSSLGLSLRQKKVLRKMFSLEKAQFTSIEWAEEGGYSADTALREIRSLLNLRLLKKCQKAAEAHVTGFPFKQIKPLTSIHLNCLRRFGSTKNPLNTNFHPKHIGISWVKSLFLRFLRYYGCNTKAQKFRFSCGGNYRRTDFICSWRCAQ